MSDKHTLAIDIGGTGLKASVLDGTGKMLVDRVRVPTPYPLTPEIFLNTIAEMIKPLPPFDRISAGYPGFVRDGVIITSPHFGDSWIDFPLAGALAETFGKPARVINDAEVQGFGMAFNDYVGNAALKKIGPKKWGHRVHKTIKLFRELMHYEHLYIGGGNAAKLTPELVGDAKLVSNEMGLTGGIRLWDDESTSGGPAEKPKPARRAKK
jgi:polyphosphate glucokinase